MKIISKVSGEFRSLLKQCSFSSHDLEKTVLNLDKFIREHPYFQKSHSFCSFYLPHMDSYDAMLGSVGYFGRDIIGTPMNLAKQAGFITVDGHKLQYLSSEISLSYEFSTEELYKQYQAMKSEVSDFELGDYWRFELSFDSQFTSEVHMLPIEEKLFSQFVNY